MMDYDYDDYVTKYSNSFKRVLIDENYMERISRLAERIVDAKSTEMHHLVDHNQEIKRFTTGLMGEAALESLFGIKIIDWTVGVSNYYHRPDIPGYSVGIKTVERGKFPIIFKRNDYPQIICIRSDKYYNLVFICGLATVETLNQCQSDELIVDPHLRSRGTKTGFWGFKNLIPIQSLSDIEQYKRE